MKAIVAALKLVAVPGQLQLQALVDVPGGLELQASLGVVELLAAEVVLAVPGGGGWSCRNRWQ